jgi:mycothiol synthase
VDKLPDGYEIRPATIDDLDAVGAVMLAADVGPSGGSDLAVDMIRDLWSSPSVDLAQDAWVVVSAGKGIVAYAHVQEDGDARLKGWGDVHPEHVARGIGSTLLERAEARACERFASVPTGLLELAVADWNHDASWLLRSRGFEHVRSFRHMQIDLDGAPTDPGQAPEGIEIRGIDADDLPAIHAIFLDAFREEWGYREVSFGEWKANEVDTPSYDPSLWFVAEDDSAPVGAVSGLIWGELGWVGELGVRKPWRGRGIAAALLRRSFATFASRGLTRVRLNVDAENPTDAVALYERVGMRKVRGWDIYEKRFV